MGLFDRITSLFDDWSRSLSGPAVHEPIGINPATGLPAVGSAGDIDVAGNPFGADRSEYHDPWQYGSMGGGHDLWRND